MASLAEIIAAALKARTRDPRKAIVIANPITEIVRPAPEPRIVNADTPRLPSSLASGFAPSRGEDILPEEPLALNFPQLVGRILETPIGMVLSGLGANRIGRAGYDRLMSVGEPPPGAIKADPYALREGPIDRRSFFYRASNAPKKAAENRAQIAPNILDRVAKELEGLGKYDIKGRGKAMSKITKEAELLEQLHDKYGVLNHNLEIFPEWTTPEKNPFRGGSRPISNSTFSKYAGKIRMLLRATPKTIEDSSEAYNDPRVKGLDESARRIFDDNEKFQALNKHISEVRSQIWKAEQKALEDVPYDTISFEELRRRKYGAGVPYRVELDRLMKEMEEVSAPLNEEYKHLVHRRLDLIKELTKVYNSKDNPEKFLSPQESLQTALDEYNRRVGYANRGHAEGQFSNRVRWGNIGASDEHRALSRREAIDKTREERLRLAREMLLRQVSQIGGPYGKVARDIAQAYIEGRQAVTDLRDNTIRVLLDEGLKRMGVKGGLKPVQEGGDVYRAARYVAEQAKPENIVNDMASSLAKSLKKRFGIK